MTAGGSTTWFGFTEEIFTLGIERGLLETKPKLTPITTADYPTPAQRPKNSVLSNDRFENAFGFRLPAWQQGLTDVMAAIADENKKADAVA